MRSNPGLGDALQGAKVVLFPPKHYEAFLNSVDELELAELRLGNVAE